jgi:hypothetical protein
MFDSRRRFLGQLGVGVAGAAGLLLPGAAQATWRGRGRAVCCPPPDLCLPPPVIDLPRLIQGTSSGPLTWEFPNKTVNQLINGNGFFCAWGKIDINNKFAATKPLKFVDGPSSSTEIPRSYANLTSGLDGSTNPANWFAQCYVPPGAPFWLMYSYTDPNGNPKNNSMPYDGSYICVGY